MARNTSALEAFCAGKVIGRPGMISWSLANATRLPVSVTRADEQARCITTPVGVGMSAPAS